MYNEKEFNELEAMALLEGLYIDSQLITATPTFTAATCTVSDKNGKRIFRAVSGKSVSQVTEQAMTLALCAYYEKPIPAQFTVKYESLPADSPIKTPSVGSGKHSDSAVKAATPQSNQNGTKTTQPPAAGDQSAEKKDEKKAIRKPDVNGSDGDEKDNKKETVKNDTIANTQASAESTGSTDGGAENFRIMVGKYRDRDDNYIKQMLETEDGRKFLTKIIHIGSPSAQIKPYLDKTKAYLDSYGIQL